MIWCIRIFSHKHSFVLPWGGRHFGVNYKYVSIKMSRYTRPLAFKLQDYEVYTEKETLPQTVEKGQRNLMWTCLYNILSYMLVWNNRKLEVAIWLLYIPACKFWLINVKNFLRIFYHFTKLQASKCFKNDTLYVFRGLLVYKRFWNSHSEIKYTFGLV